VPYTLAENPFIVPVSLYACVAFSPGTMPKSAERGFPRITHQPCGEASSTKSFSRLPSDAEKGVLKSMTGAVALSGAAEEPVGEAPVATVATIAEMAVTAMLAVLFHGKIPVFAFLLSYGVLVDATVCPHCKDTILPAAHVATACPLITELNANAVIFNTKKLGTSPTVIQPAKNAVVSQPNGGSAHQGGPIRPLAPAPTNTAAAPVRTGASAATPAPTAPALPPASQGPSAPQVPAPEVTTPEVTVPQVATPQIATPQVATPEVATPEVATPEVAAPQVEPPIVSVPEVTPQPVPHPVGPIVLHVPTVSDPAIPALVAPAASNPVISLKPDVTIPVVIPSFPAGAGQ
jgi:hypothetical protein